MLEPQMSTTDQLNRNLDSNPVLCSDTTTHSTEALRDVLSKLSTTSKHIQAVVILPSALENIHDVHQMTLSDSANNDSISNTTKHEAIDELLAIPFEATDRKHNQSEKTKY